MYRSLRSPGPHRYFRISLFLFHSRFRHWTTHSLRRDAEEWFGSLTRFATQWVGKGRLPTSNDLKALPYHYQGWALEAAKLIYDVSEHDLFNKAHLIKRMRATSIRSCSICAIAPSSFLQSMWPPQMLLKESWHLCRFPTEGKPCRI